MHFITKVSTTTSMIVIMKDWLLVKKVQKQRSEGSLYSTTTIPNKQTNNEKGKALCFSYDNEDYKEKLTAAGEYHSLRNSPNTNHMESFTENSKQMTMQLDELDVHAKPVLWRCLCF